MSLNFKFRYNFKTTSLCFIIGTAILNASGCKFKSESQQKSLESKDFFRKGKDRFYLAQLKTKKVLSSGSLSNSNNSVSNSTHTIYRGQEILVGLGCVQEPDDWKAPDPQNSARTLNQRRYYNPTDANLSDFPLAKDPKNPKEGECIVLMGDSVASLNYSGSGDNPLLDVVGTGFNIFGTASAAMVCGGCIAASIGSAGTLAPACFAGLAASASISAGVNAVSVVGGAQSVSKGIGNTVLSGIPCGDLVQSGFTFIQDEKKKNNRKVFFEKFKIALDYGIQTASQKNPEIAKFMALNRAQRSQYSASPKVRIFTAEINNHAVPYYNGAAGNEDTHGKIEQGWFGAQDFFEQVKQIDAELKGAMQSASSNSVQ